MKNILMVSHSDFPANSAVHVHHFANELVKLGYDCVVAVPHNKDSVGKLKGNLYKVAQYNEIEQIQALFCNQQSPDLVHAWTPREHVRIFCNALSAKYEFKLVIHLEDSEESVIQRFLNLSLEQILEEDEDLIPYNLSHPRKYKEFLHTADSVTIIIDSLKDYVPESIPTATIFPGVDNHQFSPRLRNSKLISSLNIPENVTILCYTGNVHLANQEEVRCLYLAVGQRNLEGKPTILIRTGIDNNLQFLQQNELWVEKYVIELGWVDRQQIPDILSLADVLIQPGKPDDFNDYRFPSKIPEFLASGKPIIIPDTNIANHLQHLDNALILPVVDQESLPRAIDLLVDNPDLAKKIAQSGLEFALTNLNWSSNTKKLVSFYKSLFAPEKQSDSARKALKRVKFHFQEYSNQKGKELAILQSTLQQTENQVKKLQNLNHSSQQKIDSLETELQNLNHSSQQKIDSLKSEIMSMRTSKFWKIREKWFKLKCKINFQNS